MIEYYAELKGLHVACVIASGTLFLVRGLAVQAGARWAMVAPLRFLSYAIDTVLLASAVTLSILLAQYPFVQGWLTAKVLLLVVYIVLGSLALKRGRTRRARHASFVAALLIYGFIVTVALEHHPLGIFHRFLL